MTLHQTQTTIDSNPFDPASAARSILPVLQAESAQSEMDRRLVPPVVSALRNSGLSRMLVPKRFNGYELPPSHHIRSCTTLAHGCSAASWVHMVCGAHSFVVGRYPEKCQEEVFGGNPDVLIPGTLAPQGKARKVPGGWLINGRWQFGSGVDHGPWLLLGARAFAETGDDPLPPVHVVVPKSDIVVDDTWFTLGLRATGSKDLIASDVFVPDYRAMATLELFRGDFAGDAGPLYRLPVTGGLSSMLAATVLGISQRGMEKFVDVTRVRDDVYAGGSKAAKVGIQLRLAESLGELEIAETLIDKNCDLLDSAMAENELPVAIEDAAQIRWNAAYSVELCRRATDRIYAVAGAHATYNDSLLQRWYRDVNTASHHAIVDFDGISETRGRMKLGLAPAPGSI
ncbi:MAG: acyl-CoA dehydrogenase family protein [Gammaproteobacteria bacterium]|nr:acyl-CoA dehydrogenase family protein [Gammaproteobacteria bacterium]